MSAHCNEIHEGFGIRFVLILSLTIVAGVISCCASSVRTVTIHRKDGATLSGKIIAVKNGCVFVDTSGKVISGSLMVAPETQDELRRRGAAWSQIRASTLGLRLDSSDLVRLEGRSYWATGLLAGLGVAVIATMLTGSGESSGILNKEAMKTLGQTLTFIIVAPVASLLGVVLGAVASSPEQTLSATDPQIETELRDASLLKDSTPRELDDLQCESARK